MKKFSSLFLALAMVLSLTACGSETSTAEPAGQSSPDASAAAPDESAQAGEAVELTVFAAASMTETLTEIAQQYETVAPNVTLTFNFDSSGTLQTQIEEGAVCDLFLSAGQKQMDALAQGDYLLADSRLDLLENKVTLCVPEGNPAGIQDFDDLAAKLKDGTVLMAMGNSDVPVGQYTQNIFAYYGLDEAALSNSLTYGTNVKEVTTQVSEGSVDCGVIYCTDAYSAGLEIVDYATPEQCGQVIYPAAVLSGSQHQQEAQRFLDYLSTDVCMAVFEQVGFSPVTAGQ